MEFKGTKEWRAEYSESDWLPEGSFLSGEGWKRFAFFITEIEGETDKEGLANLNLAKAAPDLLNALNNILNEIKEHTDPQEWKCYEEGIEAIEKATKGI